MNELTMHTLAANTRLGRPPRAPKLSSSNNSQAVAILLAGAMAIAPLQPIAAQQESLREAEKAVATQSLSVESQILDNGRYRLEGEGFVATSASEALRILAAFEQHCAEGCRWPISSIDHLEIVEEAEGGAHNATSREETTLFTWTFIDDVLDASYFQRVRFHIQDGAARLSLETPSAEEIDGLRDEKRTHEPFFHDQKVIWRAEPANQLTRIHVVMEMASDKFMVNLMPSRVIAGAEQTLQEYFAHVAAAVENDPIPDAGE